MFLYVLNKFMLTIKNSYLLYLVVLCVALTLLLIICGNLIFKELIAIKATVAAIGMFTVFEVFSVLFIENKSKKQNLRQSVNVLMGMKVGKTLLTLLFFIVYAFTVHVELERFIIVFLVLYFLYLFSDTIYLTRREKRLKETIKKESNTTQ